jgi:TPR repeat protein
LSGRTDIFKPATKPHWVSQRERAATRDTLVGVARKLVARDGEPALTLSAVADEAGLPRAAVYGFFSGRAELLRALSPAPAPAKPEACASAPGADDDDAAIWMNYQLDLSEFLPESVSLEEDEPAEPESEPAPVEAETPKVEEPPPEPEMADTPVEPEAAELTPAPEPAPAAAEQEPDAAPSPAEIQLEILAQQDERRRLQATHLDEIAKRLILPESAIKDGTDAVIARLDTRIKVLEKSIAGLETRQNAAEAEGETKLKPVNAEIEQLHARADAADAKQLKTISELRLSIHQLETRLGALQAPQRVPVSGAQAWSEPQPVPAQPESEAEPAAPEAVAPEAEPEPVTEDAQADNPKHDYLSAVRSLAKEGARQAAERETQFEEERHTRRRRMIIAASVAILCLGIVGVLYLFHPGGHGVSAAQSRPAPLPRTAMHAPVAPLDRLSALAEKGNADAELLIGLKYLSAGGNDTLAARWLSRAAAQGDAVAENALGALYQNGRGVSADLTKAARLYEAAAAQGNRHAMSNLAVLYAGAGGEAKDMSEAARWFERSASLGYVDAQFNLAVLYERGDGVPQNLLDAYKWYAIAARSGDAVAGTRADAIATQISADELAAAQHAVAEFKPQAPDRKANDVPSLPQVLAAR